MKSEQSPLFIETMFKSATAAAAATTEHGDAGTSVLGLHTAQHALPCLYRHSIS